MNTSNKFTKDLLKAFDKKHGRSKLPTSVKKIIRKRTKALVTFMRDEAALENEITGSISSTLPK